MEQIYIVGKKYSLIHRNTGQIFDSDKYLKKIWHTY